MVAKQGLSLRLNETDMKSIIKLMNSETYEKQNAKIEGCIRMLDKLYNLSEKDLKGYFSYSEAICMLNIFKNSIDNIDYNIDLKKRIIEKIKNSKNMEIYFSIYKNIDFELFISKVKKLSEVECFVIINKIVDYWRNNSINIEDMTIVSSEYNMYSINISIDTNIEELEKIKQEIIPYINKNFIIIESIELNKATIHSPSTTIIIKSKNKLDLLSKLQLKEKIISISKTNKNIDININDIYAI